MDALAIARAVVVGHSMGSLVARRVAVDHAERVAALMLIGGFAAVKGNAAAEALWHDAIASMRDPVDAAFVRDFQQSTLARPVPAAFFEEVVAQSLKMPARVWQSTFRALLDEDCSDDLVRVTVPTTIVWGDQDAFSGRAEQERMAREIPQARLNVYAGTGHSPQWKNPRGSRAICWRCCWRAARATRRERVRNCATRGADLRPPAIDRQDLAR